MEQVTRSAPPQGGRLTWIGKLERNWRGDFADERQEAIWNKACASALYLVGWVGVVAALVFVTVDADRYAPCALALDVIAVAGPVFAQAVARRQDVRPVSRVPSWPSLALDGLLMGVTFYVYLRAMEPGHGWRTQAILSVVVAGFWAITLRLVLQQRRNSADRRADRGPGGR